MLRVETWAEYVRRIAGTLTQLQIAEKTGVAQTNIGRWLRGDPGMPKADSVVAFARAFKQPPVEALIAAGYLSIEEGSAKKGARTPIKEYSTDELLTELSRRTIR